MLAGRWNVHSDVYPEAIGRDRFEFAGLTRDGSRCFGAADRACGVWVLDSGVLEWEDIDEEVTWPLRANGPYITLPASAGSRDVRLFGPYDFGSPMTNHQGYSLRGAPTPAVDPVSHRRSLEQHVELLAPDGTIRRLDYTELSGDYVISSFSDDGSTIAILEPYSIRCYRTASSSSP